MENGKKSFEAIVGFLTLLLCGLFVTHVIRVNNAFKKEEYKDTLYAKFRNIDGIKDGSEIKISGIRVGFVDKVQLDTSNFQVKVKLNLIENLNIPEDSIISVASSSFFGGKFLDIKPGVSDVFLTNGASFTNTQSALNIEDIINKAVSTFASK